VLDTINSLDTLDNLGVFEIAQIMRNVMESDVVEKLRNRFDTRSDEADEEKATEDKQPIPRKTLLEVLRDQLRSHPTLDEINTSDETLRLVDAQGPGVISRIDLDIPEDPVETSTHFRLRVNAQTGNFSASGALEPGANSLAVTQASDTFEINLDSYNGRGSDLKIKLIEFIEKLRDIEDNPGEDEGKIPQADLVNLERYAERFFSRPAPVLDIRRILQLTRVVAVEEETSREEPTESVAPNPPMSPFNPL
jgi:hypothetical protein